MLGLPSFDFVAGKALLVMNGNHAAATGTTVDLALLPQKEREPFGADHIEIVDRAYPVRLTISPIEFAESLTGIAVTFKTEINSIRRQQLTSTLEVGTLLVTRAASRAVADAATFFRNVIDKGEIKGTG